jgi:hypothetical protein
MRLFKYAALALAMLAFGCTGEGVNRAEVFKKQSGTIDLNVSSLPDAASYTSVLFEVDGNAVGNDQDGSDGWSYKLDSTTLANGIHNVKVTGTTSSGTTVELLNNSLYIDNPEGSAPAASPSPSASPDAGDGTEPDPAAGTSEEGSPGSTEPDADTSGAQLRR